MGMYFKVNIHILSYLSFSKFLGKMLVCNLVFWFVGVRMALLKLGVDSYNCYMKI